MADKYYAWTTINTEVNEYGKVEDSIAVGEEVTQGDLDMSDVEWNTLIESGAVRTEEYPKDLPPGMSPAEHYRAQEAEVAAGTADDETREAVELRLEAGIDEITQKVNAGENVEPKEGEVTSTPKLAPDSTDQAAKPATTSKK
jgi:hypothetical protein